MTESDPHGDKRSTHEPSESPPEEAADDDGAGETHGPLGNPASDEEALRNRQQEADEESGSEPGGD
jgi:hypothetical protein